MADVVMRIALVGPLPPPAGGMANQTALLAHLLSADGHDVTVVRTNAPHSPHWIGRLRGVRAVARLLPYLARLWSVFGHTDVVHVMANSGWAWHLFAAPAVWLASLRGVPVVVNYRGGEAEAFLARSARWVKLTLRRAAIVVVPSRFLEQIFGRYGVSCIVVRNIVDLSRFAPAAATKAAAGTRPHLVVTRNLEAIYDVGTALVAFAHVRNQWPQARLTVAGRGPELDTLQRQAADLGIGAAVTFVGSLGPREMEALYEDADLMLNASRVDNMPNALLEAMASGVPIVSTDAGGIPYMVEHERTALLVPCGEPALMAQAALRLLREQALAARLCENGLVAADQYAWRNVRPALLAAYRGVIQGGPRPVLS